MADPTSDPAAITRADSPESARPAADRVANTSADPTEPVQGGTWDGAAPAAGHRPADRRRITPARSRVAGVSILLASASPRRRELLGRLAVVPILRRPDVDESALPGEEPETQAARLARAKIDQTRARDGDLIIAADTLVVLDGTVLGKPRDAAHAAGMLGALSGRQHEVLTGLALQRSGTMDVIVERTEVTFRALTTAEITWYVRTGEPLDKAGAYGLQGAGAALVAGLVGSDTNVIGLPLAALVTRAALLDVHFLGG